MIELTHDLRAKLIETLLRLPITETYEGRNQLLTDIPGRDTLNRAPGNRLADLQLIIDQLHKIGQLSSDASALLLAIDNARSTAQGFQVEDELREIRDALIITPIPTSPDPHPLPDKPSLLNEHEKFLEMLCRELEKDVGLAEKIADDYGIRIPQLTLSSQSFWKALGTTHRTDDWKKIVAALVEHARSHDKLKDLHAVCITWLDDPGESIYRFAELDFEKAQTNKLPQYPEIIGRKQQIAEILQGLALSKAHISVYGPRGVGKTHVVRKVVDLCGGFEHGLGLSTPFKYVVWIDVNDVTTISTVVKEIASVLAQKTTVQLDIAREKDRVRKWLSDNRALIVVDNFENIRAEDHDLRNWLLGLTQHTASNTIIINTQRISEANWIRELKGLSDEARPFINNLARSDSLLQDLIRRESDNLDTLVEVTAGNPFALERCIGILAHEEQENNEEQKIAVLVKEIGDLNKDIVKIHKYLFKKSWQHMDKASRKLLVAMIRFSRELTKSALYEVSGLEGEFEAAWNNLTRNAILREISEEQYTANPSIDAGIEERAKKRYKFHPSVRDDVEEQVIEMTNRLDTELQDYREACRERRANYYLGLVRRVQIGGKLERYWKASVNKNMADIDVEFNNIRKILRWAEKSNRYDVILHLMLDLIHYMDHRSYHSDRIHYAALAAPAANQEANKTDDPAQKWEYRKFEALFRIDALGWTYIETGLFEDAQREIEDGLRIVKEMKTSARGHRDVTNLQALGWAWKARVLMEQAPKSKPTSTRAWRKQPLLTKVNTLISKSSRLDCDPVYKYRVAMAKGDIRFSEKQYQEALDCYTDMLKMSNQINEQIDLYQVSPRLGLADLACGNLQTALAWFEELANLSTRPIYQFYRRYGLALVKYAQGKGENNWELMRRGRADAIDAKQALDSRTPYSILFKLMNQYFDHLETVE